jgi:LPXTG-motif cell wall-anchored protein
MTTYQSQPEAPVNYEWPAPLEDAWQTQIIPLAQLGQAPRRVRRYSGKHRATRRILVALTAAVAVLAVGGTAGAHAAPAAARTIAWAVTNGPSGPEPTSATVHWPQTLYTASPAACGTPVWLQIDTYRYSAPADIARVNQLVASGHLDQGDDSGLGAGNQYWHFVLVKACATLSASPTISAPGTSDSHSSSPGAPSSASSSQAAPVASSTASAPAPAPAATKSGVSPVQEVATTSTLAPPLTVTANDQLASTGTATTAQLLIVAGLLLGGTAFMFLGRKRTEDES